MSRRVLYHIIGWALFFGIVSAVNYQNYVPRLFMPFGYFMKQVGQVGVMAVVFYLNFSLLAPKFLIQRRRGWLYFAGVIGILVVEAALTTGLGHILDNHIGKTYYVYAEWYMYLQAIILPCLIIFVSTGVRYAEEYIAERKKKEEYKEEFESAKLLALKLQLSPHFLFNTLNNIYALAEAHPEKCAKSILNLSDLMRYVVSVEKVEQIEMHSELEFLENLIELQRLRINDPEMIQVDIKVGNKDALIAPLILLSFAENAFKHTDFVSITEPVLISLTEENGRIDYFVKNRIGFRQQKETSGIGLTNLKSRLELIYGNKHELKTSEEGDFFVANLSIRP